MKRTEQLKKWKDFYLKYIKAIEVSEKLWNEFYNYFRTIMTCEEDAKCDKCIFAFEEECYLGKTHMVHSNKR